MYVPVSKCESDQCEWTNCDVLISSSVPSGSVCAYDSTRVSTGYCRVIRPTSILGLGVVTGTELIFPDPEMSLALIMK